MASQDVWENSSPVPFISTQFKTWHSISTNQACKPQQKNIIFSTDERVMLWRNEQCTYAKGHLTAGVKNIGHLIYPVETELRMKTSQEDAHSSSIYNSKTIRNRAIAHLWSRILCGKEISQKWAGQKTQCVKFLLQHTWEPEFGSLSCIKPECGSTDL